MKDPRVLDFWFYLESDSDVYRVTESEHRELIGTTDYVL